MDDGSYYYTDYGDYYQYPTHNLSAGHPYLSTVHGNLSEGEYYFYDVGPDAVPDTESHIHIVEPACLVLICIAGVVGNALVIFVITRQKWTKKVTYLYLCNLAVVNVLYLLTSVPISAVNYAITTWPFGAVMCKLHGYLTSVFLSVSVLTLTAIGVDRYLAVLHPVRFGALRTDKKAKIVMGCIWAASFALLSPRLSLYNTIILGFDDYVYCSRLTVPPAWRRRDSVALLVTMYLLPLSVLGFCHLKIGLHLWKNRRPGPEFQEVSLQGLRERRRVAKIVFALTLAFCVLWLPMHVMNMYEDFRKELLFDNRQVLVLGFSFGANAINPFLYCLLSKHFRKHFKRALACWGLTGQRKAATHETRVLEFEPARPNPDEMAVIDLEIDAGDNGVYDGGINHNDGKESSGKVGMTLADKQDSWCSNVYVGMPSQKKSTYIQVNSSHHDSEPESGDEHPTCSKSTSTCGKHYCKVSAKDSETPKSDTTRPLIKKKLVTFGPQKATHALPRVD